MSRMVEHEEHSNDTPKTTNKISIFLFMVVDKMRLLFFIGCSLPYFIHSRPKLNVQSDSMRMVKSPKLLGT